MAAYISQAQTKLQQVLQDVDRELNNVPIAVKLERQTGLPKAPVVVGVFGLVTVMVIFNILAALLTTFIGYALPAYWSLQALEHRQPGYEKQWLTYWTVFGVFVFLEQFVDIVLSWMPFYYSIKLVVLLFLQLPQTKGAALLHDRVLAPTFLNKIK